MMLCNTLQHSTMLCNVEIIRLWGQGCKVAMFNVIGWDKVRWKYAQRDKKIFREINKCLKESRKWY